MTIPRGDSEGYVWLFLTKKLTEDKVDLMAIQMAKYGLTIVTPTYRFSPISAKDAELFKAMIAGQKSTITSLEWDGYSILQLRTLLTDFV